MSMPLLGMNSKPRVYVENIGYITLIHIGKLNICRERFKK